MYLGTSDPLAIPIALDAVPPPMPAVVASVNTGTMRPAISGTTIVVSLLGFALVGYLSGKSQKSSGSKYRFGAGRAVGSVLFPGIAAYQAGRYIAYR